MDNASIHHVDEVTDLIEIQTNARLCFLPPYSPDLMPAEQVFSKVKTIIKEDTHLYQMSKVYNNNGIYNDITGRLSWIYFILWIHVKNT